MKKNVTKKIFYSAAATAVFAGSAVSGVNAIANADDDIKQFDKDSIVGGEHVNDAEAYPYSADPYPSSSEYPSSTSPAPSETPTPENPPRGNVENSIEGSGIVNCKSGEACIDPETKTAHVEYDVQIVHRLYETSGVGGHSFLDGQIAIPKILNNISVEMVSYYPDKSTSKDPAIDQEVIPVGSKLPVFSDEGSTISKNQMDQDEKLEAYRRGVENYIEQNPDMESGKARFDYFLRNVPVKLSSAEDNADLNNADMMVGEDENHRDSGVVAKNAELYNYLQFPTVGYGGIMNLKVSGDVEIDSDLEEVYLPMKAEQKFWKCSSGEPGWGDGSFEKGCQSFKELYFARTGDLPKYDVHDAEVNADLAKNYSVDGLGGNPRCAVTRETGLMDKIGKDVIPQDLHRFIDSRTWIGHDQYKHLVTDEVLEKYGVYGPYPREALGLDPMFSAGDVLNEDFLSYYNIPFDYYVSGYGVDEDGCDQAAIKLTWCPDDEETPTPSPSDTPVVPEPSPSDEPTPSSEVTSSEPPMPSDEPTPSEEPTPETTPRETPTIPEPEPRDTLTSPEDTPSTTKPAARIIPSSPAPVITPPAVKHTFPEKQPTPENPSRVNTPPFVPAQPAAIPGPVSEHGPVVNTGGAVQESFWTKIANIFR